MNTSPNIFKNGSCWLKADFHLHTKADKEEFKYEGEENDFVRKYIEQLKTQEIRVGVITNHNKFDKDEFVALRKKAIKEIIRLFPGVEFSLKEGIHILIVFDDEWYKGETDYINKFLENAFFGINNFDKPPYHNSTFDLKETVEKLKKIGLNYFIVLAHVDDHNGLFQVFKGRTQEDFIKQDAFEKVLAVQKSGNRANFEKLCNIANRKIACVEGSDNAHDGIAAIGNGRTCYIKIGDFNFEALEYALSDPDYRISPQEKPIINNSHIKSIAFEGGLLDKTKIDFSPELNNLIGIRGSGKSSILEIIRYTLGIPLSKIALDSNYKDGLIEYVMKSGGKSVITIVNDQQEEYKIEKIYGQKEDIFKDNILQSGITLDAIFDRPVYFGQKDLSNKDAHFEPDLIQRLIGARLKPVQSKIEIKKQEITTLLFELNKLQSLLEIKKDTETLIENSKYQLRVYQERGIEKKLKQQTLFESDISKISEFQKNVQKFINDLIALITDYDYFFQKEISGSQLNTDLFEEINQLKNNLKNEFEKLKNIQELSGVIHKKIQSILLKINEKKEGLKEEFAQIKREINTDTINPDNFLKLNRLIETSHLKLKEIEKSEKKRNELKQLLLKRLYELNDLWLEEYDLLKNEVNRINEAESKLNINVDFKGWRDKFIDKLKQVFKGSGIRESAYHEIETTYRDFIEIYKDETWLNDILTENQVVEFKRRFYENLEELLIFKVDNKIVIKYNNKPLDKHSLGQRASALILFLLTQKENNVLIIDQPEDDLDNQTIYDEVIKQLKNIKGKMQFIFATHNANIPVLGDSEKVIACSYDEKKISVYSGTIDNHQTQRSIVDIMEGGDEAFKRRKNIYTIWNIEKIKK